MVNELARVESNQRISSVLFRMGLISPTIAKNCIPGQFINILPNSGWSHMMRRPMSIAGRFGESISIIYKVVGEGSSALQNLKTGDSLDIIGPLGNYWTDYQDSFPILLAGGVGIAPILYFHYYLSVLNISHQLIMGTRTKEEHFLNGKYKDSVLLTTDDGSYGMKGTVIDSLDSIITNVHEQVKLFACGPPPMLNAVNRFADERKLTRYLALETIMACGFGICQGCAIETIGKTATSHSYRSHYKLVCADGPIFNGEEIPLC